MDLEVAKIDKLAKFAGMLTSDHDGEIAVAARMATRILREMGLTWAELVRNAFSPVKPQAKQGPRPDEGFGPARDRDWANDRQAGRQYERTQQAPQWSSTRDGFKAWDLIRWADAHRDKLDRWENDFITSLLPRGPNTKLSDKQWQILLRIAGTTGAKRTDHD